MLRKLYIIYTCIHIPGSWTFQVLFMINKHYTGKEENEDYFNFFVDDWIYLLIWKHLLTLHCSNIHKMNLNCLPLKTWIISLWKRNRRLQTICFSFKKSSTFDKKIFICLSYSRHHLVKYDGQMYGFHLSFELLGTWPTSKLNSYNSEDYLYFIETVGK